MISTHPPRANKRNVRLKAAKLIRGDSLVKLYKVSDNQTTISTCRLERMLDELREEMKLDGVFLLNVAGKMTE